MKDPIVHSGKRSRSVIEKTSKSTGQLNLFQQQEDTTTTSKQEFFKTIDNKLVNSPYKIAFGQGDHTCTVADWTVTLKGSMKVVDGNMIPPNGNTAKKEQF